MSRPRKSDEPEPANGITPDEEKKEGGKKLVTGLAFGIGSAAVVAALLYAGRNRKPPSK
jgi:hypothetical protein